MHHDKQSTGENGPYNVTWLDELELMTNAQRLRSLYVGQLLRRLFCGARASSAPSHTDHSFASPGGLRPRQS
jgi:hypothetical protein